MSAAVKLKARNEHGVPLVTDYGLRCALPQIVAVVEAADYYANHTVGEVNDFSALKKALAALDEALA